MAWWAPERMPARWPTGHPERCRATQPRSPCPKRWRLPRQGRRGPPAPRQHRTRRGPPPPRRPRRRPMPRPACRWRWAGGGEHAPKPCDGRLGRAGCLNGAADALERARTAGRAPPRRPRRTAGPPRPSLPLPRPRLPRPRLPRRHLQRRSKPTRQLRDRCRLGHGRIATRRRCSDTPAHQTASRFWPTAIPWAGCTGERRAARPQ